MSQASDPKSSISRRGFIRAVGLAPAVFQAVGTRTEGGSMATVPGFWHSPRHSGVLLADLSGARPREAISPKPRKGCWYTIPYRTETGIQGVMVARGQLTHPPDLRLCLPVQGWHAIYVGLFGGSRIDEFRLRLKLSDERFFESLAPSRLGYQRKPDGSWLRPRPAIGATDIEEVFWKAADLDGQQLVISHLRTSHPSVAQLAFVRLVPLTAEEVEEYRMADGRPQTRLLAAEMDGQGPFHTGARTVQDIQENLEPLRGTDVGKLFLGTGGIGAGQTLYPSRVGSMLGAGEEDFPVEAGKRAAESLRNFQSRGVDPLKVAVDHAHSMGIEVYLGFRMGTMASMPPVWFEPVNFWKTNPHWRCRDREGHSIVRLSLAYSQVRRFYLDLLAELAGYGVKGVQLIYTRRPPFVLFEPPVVEDFKKVFGIDPRRLPEPDRRRPGDPPAADERLERHWSTYVTTFMRELRERLNRQRPEGPRIEVLANVGYDADWNRHAALDLETWTREDLVDILCVYTGGDGTQKVDYDYFQKITRGTRTVFFEDVTPRNMPGSRYARQARKAYDGGAAGLAFWDSGGRIVRKTQWHTIRRLGHREDLETLALQPQEYRIHPLELIDGWSVELRYR